MLDVLTAIRLHSTLEGAGLALQGNAERYLRSPQEMGVLFADLPEAIDNSAELSQRLQFQLKDLGYEFPRYPVGEGETMISFLRERTREGFESRYGAQGLASWAESLAAEITAIHRQVLHKSARETRPPVVVPGREATVRSRGRCRS